MECVFGMVMLAFVMFCAITLIFWSASALCSKKNNVVGECIFFLFGCLGLVLVMRIAAQLVFNV